MGTRGTPYRDNVSTHDNSYSYTMNFVLQCIGSVAEWSKALVLGTSLFGGVGSNPTAANQILLVLDCLLIVPTRMETTKEELNKRSQ